MTKTDLTPLRRCLKYTEGVMWAPGQASITDFDKDVKDALGSRGIQLRKQRVEEDLITLMTEAASLARDSKQHLERSKFADMLSQKYRFGLHFNDFRAFFKALVLARYLYRKDHGRNASEDSLAHAIDSFNMTWISSTGEAFTKGDETYNDGANGTAAGEDATETDGVAEGEDSDSAGGSSAGGDAADLTPEADSAAEDSAPDSLADGFNGLSVEDGASGDVGNGVEANGSD